MRLDATVQDALYAHLLQQPKEQRQVIYPFNVAFKAFYACHGSQGTPNVTFRVKFDRTSSNQLPYATLTQLSMELVSYFERRENLNCLISTLKSQTDDSYLAQLSAKLPSCSPRTKVQIIMARDVLCNPSELIRDLAAKLNVDVDQVELIGGTKGSLCLLVGLPQVAANLLIDSKVKDLVNGRYHVTSITAYDSLDRKSKKAWRNIVRKGSLLDVELIDALQNRFPKSQR